MSDRAVAKQLPPAPGLGLERYPTVTLPAHEKVYRAHAAKNGPLYFSSNMTGRFDLASPKGTMYVADSVLAAVRERLLGMFDGANEIAESLVFDMAVSQLTLNAYLCAEVGVAGIEKYGILRELETMVPYDVPQRWAARFDEEGFGGIHYGARSTPGPNNSWAIFGDSGPHVETTPSPKIDYATACAEAGITILPRPATMASSATNAPPAPQLAPGVLPHPPSRT